MNSPATWSKLRVFVPALVLFAMGVAQMARVARTDLSRWKGGGMGMYSEFHYRERELWLRLKGEARDAQREYVGLAALEANRHPAFVCGKQGDNACLAEVGAWVRRDEVAPPFAIGLWTWDWHEGVMRRRLIKEVHIGP